MGLLYLLPWCLPLLWVTSTIVDLLLRSGAILSIRDEVITTIVFHEALRGYLVELPGLSQVIALDILSVEVVLHYVSVPVAILAFSLHVLHVANHLWIVHLVGDRVVIVCVPSCVGWRNFLFCAQLDFDLACIVSVLCILFILWIVELLSDRIESILRFMLANSLKLVQFGFSFDSYLMVEWVSIVHNVEVSNSAGMYLSLATGSLHASGAVIRPIPMVVVMRNIRNDVVILL